MTLMMRKMASVYNKYSNFGFLGIFSNEIAF